MSSLGSNFRKFYSWFKGLTYKVFEKVAASQNIVVAWTIIDFLSSVTLLVPLINYPKASTAWWLHLVDLWEVDFVGFYTFICMVVFRIGFSVVGFIGAYRRCTRTSRWYYRFLAFQFLTLFLFALSSYNLLCRCEGKWGVRKRGDFFQCTALQEFTGKEGRRFVNFLPPPDWTPATRSVRHDDLWQKQVEQEVKDHHLTLHFNQEFVKELKGLRERREFMGGFASFKTPKVNMTTSQTAALNLPISGHQEHAIMKLFEVLDHANSALTDRGLVAIKTIYRSLQFLGFRVQDTSNHKVPEAFEGPRYPNHEDGKKRTMKYRDLDYDEFLAWMQCNIFTGVKLENCPLAPSCEVDDSIREFLEQQEKPYEILYHMKIAKVEKLYGEKPRCRYYRVKTLDGEHHWATHAEVKLGLQKLQREDANLMTKSAVVELMKIKDYEREVKKGNISLMQVDHASPTIAEVIIEAFPADPDDDDDDDDGDYASYPCAAQGCHSVNQTSSMNNASLASHPPASSLKKTLIHVFTPGSPTTAEQQVSALRSESELLRQAILNEFKSEDPEFKSEDQTYPIPGASEPQDAGAHRHRIVDAVAGALNEMKNVVGSLPPSSDPSAHSLAQLQPARIVPTEVKQANRDVREHRDEAKMLMTKDSDQETAQLLTDQQRYQRSRSGNSKTMLKLEAEHGQKFLTQTAIDRLEYAVGEIHTKCLKSSCEKPFIDCANKERENLCIQDANGNLQVADADYGSRCQPWHDSDTNDWCFVKRSSFCHNTKEEHDEVQPNMYLTNSGPQKAGVFVTDMNEPLIKSHVRCAFIDKKQRLARRHNERRCNNFRRIALGILCPMMVFVIWMALVLYKWVNADCSDDQTALQSDFAIEDDLYDELEDDLDEENEKQEKEETGKARQTKAKSKVDKSKKQNDARGSNVSLTASEFDEGLEEPPELEDEFDVLGDLSEGDSMKGESKSKSSKKAKQAKEESEDDFPGAEDDFEDLDDSSERQSSTKKSKKAKDKQHK